MMDVKLINPFLAAAMHVLKTMAQVDAKPGKPFLKKDDRCYWRCFRDHRDHRRGPRVYGFDFH